MRRFIEASSAAALTVIAAAAVAQSALDPQRFVAGWPIEVPADAAFVDIPLAAEVYAAAASAEQLAVLDANGTPLSFFVRSAAPTTTEARLTLDASPLYAERPGGAAVGVTTGERGTAITVGPSAGQAATVVGFVIDARASTAPPIALELDWQSLPQPFLLDVQVEQSTDLNAWRGVGSAAVAALALGDVEVRHARVPVRATAGGYYRIRASRAVADWRLQRVTLVSATAEREEPQAVLVAPLAAAALPGDAPATASYFDAGAALPVSAVSLDFGADDGWLRADVASAPALDGPWSTLAHAELFYAVRFAGQRFASEPVALPAGAARYWRVTATAPREPGPALRLEFPQQYLRTAVAGSPPYLLAAGTREEAAGPDATLASVFGRLEAAGDVPRAAVGARRELGGDAAVAAPFPWALAALWGALGGGVLVVGWMAVRLAREMAAKSS